MKILTKANRDALPPLYSQDGKGDEAIAFVKFFTPDANWTWYITEFDGEDQMFGLCCGHEVELGYVSFAELQTVKGPMGLKVERDLHFRPTTIGQIRERRP